MRIDLDGKTAFISGSTQGIGRAIAARLADAGRLAYVNGRSAERVAAVVEELRAEQPVRASRPPRRTCRAPTAPRAVRCAAGGRILVNNLGIFGPQPLLEVDDDGLAALLGRQRDVRGAVDARLIRGMRGRGWGRVQFMAWDSAVVIPEEMVHYGVTKTALLGVSRGSPRSSRGRA